MNNSNTIKFYLGDENRLVIENSSNDSIFQEQYSNLFGNLKQIMPDIYTEKDVPPQDGVAVEKTVNNVFAFIGERGSGKSSCMISAAEMLKKGGDEVVKTIHKSDKDSGTLTFEVLETIDPSFFDEKVNILEIILGKMFSKFMETVEKDSCDSLDDFANKKNKLFESFQEVKNCLCQLNHQDISEDDSVERLVDLAASVKMQSAFQLLVNRYLDLVKKDVLVIPIDDIDLHVTGAYKMVEQIRKYLIQKNVIVLMALKLEQLEKVLENEYLQQYKSVIEKGMLSTDRITEMAAKYLIKFIPQSHRIFMPDMNIGVNRKITLYRFPKDRELNEIVDGIKDTPLKDCITKLIFEKTRYLFFHSNGLTNFIVPTNLREIRHLISMLCQMGNDVEINQQYFQHYFYDTWCKGNLNATGNDVVKEMIVVKDVAAFNKTLVLRILNKFGDLLNNDRYLSRSSRSLTYSQSPLTSEIYNIVNVNNTSFNVSLGDAFLIVSYLKERVVSGEDRLLLFALETLYTFKLQEFYRDVKNQLDCIEHIALRILIGGCYINIKGNQLIPYRKNPDEYYDYRDIHPIKTEAVLELVNKNNLISMQIAEFFCLCISRKRIHQGGSTQNSYDSWYRTSSKCFYNTSIDGGICYFDAASIFFNLLNVEYAYKRLSEDLYIKADSNPKSLLNLLREELVKAHQSDLIEVKGPIEEQRNEYFDFSGHYYYKKDIQNLLIEYYCIRNAEILSDLSKELSAIEVSVKTGNDIDNIKNYFNRIVNWTIQLNDVEIQNFQFLKVVCDILNKEEKFVDQYFEEVYTSAEKVKHQPDLVDVDRLSNTPSRDGKYFASEIKGKATKIYPFFEDEKYQVLLEKYLPKGKSFTKEELINSLEMLNIELKELING